MTDARSRFSSMMTIERVVGAAAMHSLVFEAALVRTRAAL
jgi:hypothetical protein